MDAAEPGDLVLVTNGVYATGGRTVGTSLLTNRVAVTKALTLQSINGPDATIIMGRWDPGTTNGDSAVRCAYLTNGAVLSGFTLSGGATRAFAVFLSERSGGGVWCNGPDVVVSNCVLVGNSASFSGGGVYGGTLYNCKVIGNSALNGGGARSATLNCCIIATNAAVGSYGPSGGGVYSGTLFNCILAGNSSTALGGGVTYSYLTNCTLVGNSASNGGGGLSSTFRNCVLYYNTASPPWEPNYSDGRLSSCCVSPAPAGGGNFSYAPLLVDLAGGDLRLQSNSPCINAGNNGDVASFTDLDGNPRIVGGTVDVGAYEFQSPFSLLSYAWARQNGLPTDGSADFTDDDGDGANNWQEWRADTIPTNALSVLRMASVTNGVLGLDVTWQSVSTRNYWLERATNLGDVPPFRTIATNIAGASGTKTYTDASATNGGPCFYRVGVQP